MAANWRPNEGLTILLSLDNIVSKLMFWHFENLTAIYSRLSSDCSELSAVNLHCTRTGRMLKDRGGSFFQQVLLCDVVAKNKQSNCT